MNAMDHFTQLFPAVSAGFGLFLAGVANLALHRRGLAIRAGATLAAGGVAVGGVWALGQTNVVATTAAYFALGLVPFLLLTSRLVTAGLAAVITATHRTPVRYGLLTVAGLGLTLGAVVVFERTDERITREMTDELDLMQGRVPTVPCEGVKAATDKGSPVVLREPSDGTPDGKLGQCEQKVLADSNLGDKIVRRGPADPRANCHGWVFTGGKFIVSGDDVERILRENGYQEVHDPQGGDVVVYRQNGVVAHTAVVRYVTEGQPVLVEGKWGNLGVFLHAADTCPYGKEYTFHRSPRAGHQLVGLGGQPASGDARLPVAAD